jgi:hypothetical protein
MINQRSISISEAPRTSVAGRNISIDGLQKRSTSQASKIAEDYSNKKSMHYIAQEKSKVTEDEDFKKLIDDKIYKLKMKFWWFSWIASLNHALNYVTTSYASSLLDPLLGGIILGLTWTLNAVSGLTIATPAVRILGFKTSMVISLWGYAIQIATLYWAVVTDDVNTAWTVAIIGSTVAGFTSAIWWTSQGVYFDDICVAIDEQFVVYEHHVGSVSFDNLDETADATPNGSSKPTLTIDSIRADLASHWTMIYQSADIIVFLSLSIFPITGVISITEVLLGLVILGVITSVLGMSFENVKVSNREVSMKEIYNGVVAVPKQFKTDARVSLLAPFVFGFGITTAMFAYYINDDVVSSNLGTVTLGFLEAWSYFVAVLSAYPYSWIANRFVKGQDWVIQFGSFAFLLCGVFVLSFNDETLGLWPVILFVKGLYGLGRGVFEGSCRAVYAQMFTGEDLSTAFSGQTLSAGFSGGICFFLFGVLNQMAIASITIVNGLVAIATYSVLMYGVEPTKRVPWKAICCNTHCRQTQQQLVGASVSTSGNRSGEERNPMLNPRPSEGGLSLHEPLI